MIQYQISPNKVIKIMLILLCIIIPEINEAFSWDKSFSTLIRNSGLTRNGEYIYIVTSHYSDTVLESSMNRLKNNDYWGNKIFVFDRAGKCLVEYGTEPYTTNEVFLSENGNRIGILMLVHNINEEWLNEWHFRIIDRNKNILWENTEVDSLIETDENIQYIVSSSLLEEVPVWLYNSMTNNKLCEYEYSNSNGCYIARNGKYILREADNKIEYYELSGDIMNKLFEKTEVNTTWLPVGTSISKNGDILAVYDLKDEDNKSDDRIIIISKTGQIVGEFIPSKILTDIVISNLVISGTGDYIAAYANNTFGSFLIFIDNKGTLKWVNISHRLEKNIQISSIDMSCDGSYIVVVYREANSWRITIFNNKGYILKEINIGNYNRCVAYISDDGNLILYEYGEKITCLIRNKNLSPSWSPESTRILYETNAGGRWGISGMELAGTSKVAGETEVSTRAGCWHPSGRIVGYVSKRGDTGSYDLYIRNIFTNEETAVLQTKNADETSPCFSPRGDKMLYGSNESGKWHVYEIEIATKKVRQLTTGDSDEVMAKYSPDGKSIVYASSIRGNWDIYIKQIEDGSIRQLTNSNADEIYPCWSPNGRKVAYCSNESYTGRPGIPNNPDGDWKIYVRNADGVGEVIQITEEEGNHRMPDWSGNGRKIAYVSDEKYFEEIFVKNADGTGEPMQVTGGE